MLCATVGTLIIAYRTYNNSFLVHVFLMGLSSIWYDNPSYDKYKELQDQFIRGWWSESWIYEKKKNENNKNISHKKYIYFIDCKWQYHFFLDDLAYVTSLYLHTYKQIYKINTYINTTHTFKPLQLLNILFK